MKINKTPMVTLALLLSTALSAQWVQAADYTNSVGMDFVSIKSGCFNMGREPYFMARVPFAWVWADIYAYMVHDVYDGSELPRHRVCFKKTVYMGKTEVTQAQWVAVMGSNPSEFKGRNNPVENVSWEDTQDFIRRLNKKEGGKHYRLPTEAEWEYAARAGSSSLYHFGDDIGALSQFAWYAYEAVGERTTHSVAQKRPNQWGLYDMHGNVWEWVQDRFDENYYHNSPTYDPKGPSTGRLRASRGGGFSNIARNVRSATRNYFRPDNRAGALGFRLVRQSE